MEGLGPKRAFLTDKMNELVSDTPLSVSFLYVNRPLADANIRKCHKCVGSLKPHDPVTKVRRCGHMYHTDCYVKH